MEFLARGVLNPQQPFNLVLILHAQGVLPFGLFLPKSINILRELTKVWFRRNKLFAERETKIIVAYRIYSKQKWSLPPSDRPNQLVVLQRQRVNEVTTQEGILITYTSLCWFLSLISL